MFELLRKELKTEDQKNTIKVGKFQPFWDVAILVSLLIGAGLIRGFQYTAPAIPTPPGFINTSDIASRSNQLLGKTVSLRGKPIDVVGLDGFVLDDNQYFRGRPVLVLNATGEPISFPADSKITVQVVGQFRNLDIPEIQRDYKLNLDPESYKGYINQPVIVAQHIGQEMPVGLGVADIERYSGQTLAATGRVKSVISPSLFTISSNNSILNIEEVLVMIPTQTRRAIKPGETVAVIGKVRPFVLGNIRRDYKITGNLGITANQQNQYKNTPVLVADVVYP